MKMMKLFYPLAFALAVSLTTGCHNHKVTKLTPLPGSPRNVIGSGGDPTTLSPGTSLNPDPGVRVGVGAGPLPDIDPNAVNEDHIALAAYTIHFAYDSAAIKKSEQSNLQSVAQALSANPKVKLKIEGNCDERGTQEYNRSLGERRALAAREALAKLGIDPMRIVTISYGKDKPVDPANNEAAWAKNRRDDFVLLHPKTGF